MDSIIVQTKNKEELIDITFDVQEIVNKKNVESGICFIYTQHTTSAITINENADPTVKRDIIKGLGQLKLESVKFSHMEGNSPAHIKSTIVGPSEIIFIEDRKLKLGTWQGIFFCEFDGPRTRTVIVKII